MRVDPKALRREQAVTQGHQLRQRLKQEVGVSLRRRRRVVNLKLDRQRGQGYLDPVVGLLLAAVLLMVLLLAALLLAVHLRHPVARRKRPEQRQGQGNLLQLFQQLVQLLDFQHQSRLTGSRARLLVGSQNLAPLLQDLVFYSEHRKCY